MARKPPPPRTDERLALFAGVKQTPDDDAPRLVLADWLEEHGDADDVAHAELIRVAVSPHLRRLQLRINEDGASAPTLAALRECYCMEKV